MQSRRRVLIVDDEPNDAYLLIEAFAELGLPHELSTVSDGLEAIRYLAGDAPTPTAFSIRSLTWYSWT